MIYLDTHVILWLYEGLLDQLSDFAKQQIEENDLIISPIVCLELQYLFEIKRITRKSEVILNELVNKISLEISQEPFQKIVETALTLSWTRDPFDRLIVATAQISNTLLLTKDKNITLNYKYAVWN